MGGLFSCCCGTEDDEGGEYGERTRLISECNTQTQVSGGMDTMVEDMDRDTYFQHTTILQYCQNRSVNILTRVCRELTRLSRSKHTLVNILTIGQLEHP